ncbi:MAG TPA: cytochrome P450 [Myxococcaceae bacterium]|nr:cytochrome P450 [Myxococcaceae bacterium]
MSSPPAHAPLALERELWTPEVRANPYPLYARLRKTSPVSTLTRPYFGTAWVLSRYEDVSNALKDPRLVNDRRTLGGSDPFMDRWWMPKTLKAFQNTLIATDDPQHRRLRNLVHQAFTPRRVEDLRGKVERLTADLLTRAEKKPAVDLRSDFALPLPLTIISELLGLPEQDRPRFQRAIAQVFDSGEPTVLNVLGKIPRALGTLRFFRQLIQQRRDRAGEDLLSALVAAEEQGDRLSGDELIAMLFLLLLAGYETTVNLIGNGTLALLEHPEQLRLLRDRPELIDSAVEELLRFTNPVEQPAPRYAREDIELHGHVIPRGAMVVLLLASANRDEEAFPNADALDLTRGPNRHVGLGYGVHYCLGAPLARLEARTALLALIQRYPKLRLAVPAEQLRWRNSASVRGLAKLPVQLI